MEKSAFLQSLAQTLAFSVVYEGQKEWSPGGIVDDVVGIGKSYVWDTGYLMHLFQNASCPTVGDANGLQPSASAAAFFVSLHTADPGAAGNQATSEVSYTGYGRAAVSRNTTGWNVDGLFVQNGTTVIFGACTAGSVTASNFGVGTALTGNGTLLYSGTLVSSLIVSTGITPEFAAQTLIISES